MPDIKNYAKMAYQNICLLRFKQNRVPVQPNPYYFRLWNGENYSYYSPSTKKFGTELQYRAQILPLLKKGCEQSAELGLLVNLTAFTKRQLGPSQDIDRIYKQYGMGDYYESSLLVKEELVFLKILDNQWCKNDKEKHAYTFYHLTPNEKSHVKEVHKTAGITTELDYEIFAKGNAFIFDPWSSSLDLKTTADDIEKLLNTLCNSASVSLTNGTLTQEQISKRISIILQSAENGSYLQTQFGSIVSCNVKNLLLLWNSEYSSYSATIGKTLFPIRVLQKMVIRDTAENLDFLLNTSCLMSYSTALNKMIEEYAAIPRVLSNPETLQDLKMLQNKINELNTKFLNKPFTPSEVKKEFLLVGPTIKNKVILEGFLYYQNAQFHYLRQVKHVINLTQAIHESDLEKITVSLNKLMTLYECPQNQVLNNPIFNKFLPICFLVSKISNSKKQAEISALLATYGANISTEEYLSPEREPLSFSNFIDRHKNDSLTEIHLRLKKSLDIEQSGPLSVFRTYVNDQALTSMILNQSSHLTIFDAPPKDMQNRLLAIEFMLLEIKEHPQNYPLKYLNDFKEKFPEPMAELEKHQPFLKALSHLEESPSPKAHYPRKRS